VNSGGEPPLSCSASFATLFLGAAMTIPAQRVMNLSSSTQTGVEGLLLEPKGLICRSAVRREIFEINSVEF
jgi:hypothetical protein